MFQNAAIDVAIALALMYLLLSLACTVINEYIATKLNLRSKSLEVALQAILDDQNVRRAFYAHGFVAGTTNAVAKARDLMPQPDPTQAAPPPATPAPPAAAPIPAAPSGTHPSYVSTETFVLALIGSLAARQLAPGQPIPGFADVQTAIQNLPPSNLKDALVTNLTMAQGDFDRFRKSVATWFDDSMDRLSGAYKRNLKFISIVVGCIVAVILNADTFEVGRKLWSDSALRAQMVQVADATLKTPPTASTDKATPQAGAAPSPAGSAPSQPAGAQTTNAQVTGDANAAKTPGKQFEDVAKSLQDANEKLRPLPIGWSEKKKAELLSSPLWSWLLKLLGLFVTGLALSLGAPFWFDTLSKFMNIRATGVKPARQT